MSETEAVVVPKNEVPEPKAALTTEQKLALRNLQVEIVALREEAALRQKQFAELAQKFVHELKVNPNQFWLDLRSLEFQEKK